MSFSHSLSRNKFDKNNPSGVYSLISSFSGTIFNIFGCKRLIVYQLCDNVEQEQPEITCVHILVNCFLNLWHNYTL